MSLTPEQLWPVQKTGNIDNEREQINKILRAIIDSLGAESLSLEDINQLIAEAITELPSGEDGEDGQGVPAGGTAGQVLEKIDSTDFNTQWATPSSGGETAPIGAAWFEDDGTTAIASAQDVRIYIPNAITISQVDIQTKGGTGSCVLDILNDDLEGNETSIVASAAPEISSDTSYTDSTLTGWTTSISGNTELIFRVDSTSTFTFIEVLLTV